MNAPHIHLLLNHLPTVGFSIGLALFVLALPRHNDELQLVSLVMLFMTAALTIATYVSGSDAQQALKETAGVSDPLMQAHESAALVAFIFMQVTGLFSWVGLWLRGRLSHVPNWNLAAVLALATVTFALMARAANIGGEIRHSEIQQSPAAASVSNLAASWAEIVQNNTWVWPTCETVHFLGLCLLFGVVLTVDLRLLGVGKGSLSFEGLYQLLPLGMLGFALNLITGMMFFVATPKQYTGSFFFLKMMLVVAGAVNVLYFMLSKAVWNINDGDDAPIVTKLVATSALLIWIAVLFCGHMLPWLGNSF